jgi:hypothetical protein
MPLTEAYISHLEQNEQWQATAENKHGYPVVIYAGMSRSLI